MLTLLVLACDSSDPTPSSPPDVTDTGAPADTGTPSGPTTAESGHTGSVPSVAEIPCNGLDDDGDGWPVTDGACTPEAHPLYAEDPYPLSLLADLDGDGLDDLLSTARERDGIHFRSVLWVASGLPPLTIEDAAYATLHLDNWMIPVTAGSDAAPGRDLWIGHLLFSGPLGPELSAEDAVAVIDVTPDGGIGKAAHVDCVVDRDGDGDDDVLVSHHRNGDSAAVRALVDGPVPAAIDVADFPSVTVAHGGSSACLGDSDGDGVAEYTAADLLRGGEDCVYTGAFEQQATLPSADTPVALGDFDGDGLADVVVVDEEERRSVVPGPFRGRVDVQDAAIWRLGARVVYPTGDLDGDGAGEVVVGDFEAETGSILSHDDQEPIFGVSGAAATLGYPFPAWGIGELDGQLGRDALSGQAVYLDLLF